MRIDVSFAAPQAAAQGATFAADTDAERRRITGVAIPFGVPSDPSADGHRYQFSGPPDNVDDLVDVVVEHDDDAVAGRLSEPFTVTETGLDASARIFRTSRGNDLLEETHEGVRTGFSMSAAFDAFDEDADGVRHVASWSAVHLGVVRRPAFTASRGLTLAASAQREDTMTTTTEPATTPATPPAAPAVVELPTVEELAQQVAAFQAQATQSGTHPLARFASRAEFAAAFQNADEEERQRLAAQFALQNQITGDNPGVIPPGWRTEIKANLDKRRPAITWTGGPIGLPDAGLDSNWPFFDGDLDAIIAKQAAEKTELNSVKISIKKASAPLLTAGVVSDISYQLLMRSAPSYLAAYQAICEAAWARYTEAQYEAALLAAATDAGLLPADLTNAAGAASFRAQLFDASAQVEDATGTPATVAFASPTVFSALGGNDAFKTPDYGTQNVAGTASAKTLRINVNGLEVVRAPFFAGSKVLVTNEEAAKFAESGPMVATQEDVAKLGRDVAVWGMYEDAEVYFPAGLVLLDED